MVPLAVLGTNKSTPLNQTQVRAPELVISERAGSSTGLEVVGILLPSGMCCGGSGSAASTSTSLLIL